MFLKEEGERGRGEREEEEEEEEGRGALASPLKQILAILALVANKVLDKFILFRPLIGTFYQKAPKVCIDLIIHWY
jgi:hypothetical protein